MWHPALSTDYRLHTLKTHKGTPGQVDPCWKDTSRSKRMSIRLCCKCNTSLTRNYTVSVTLFKRNNFVLNIFVIWFYKRKTRYCLYKHNSKRDWYNTRQHKGERKHRRVSRFESRNGYHPEVVFGLLNHSHNK